jgi:DNA-binding CsgD family transcriptional regulator
VFVLQQRELEDGIAEGLSIAQLAERFGCSKATVRHWLGKYRLKTQHRSKRGSTPEALLAHEAGRGICVQLCASHGETEFVLEGRGYFRCRKCRSEAVAKRRRRVKEILAAEAGGRCVLCGYSRSIRALEFHHLDPTLKRFGLSARGITQSLETLRREARKCVLLCSNCHAEVEDGLVSVPIHLVQAEA